jgi:hypothetical protein
MTLTILLILNRIKPLTNLVNLIIITIIMIMTN